MSQLWRYEPDTHTTRNGDQHQRKPLYAIFRGPERIGVIYDAVAANALCEAMNDLVQRTGQKIEEARGRREAADGKPSR